MLHSDVSAFASKKILGALALTLLLIGVSSQSSPLRAAPTPYMVKDINPNGGTEPLTLTRWKGNLFFQVLGTPRKNGLWRSDGTAQGTTRLRKLDLSSNSRFLRTKKYLYFTADDGEQGVAPWLTDGTRLGTRLITQRTPGARLVGRAGNLAYLAWSDTNAYELWRTDGNARGTRKIANVIADDGIAVGNTFFFIGWNQTPPIYANALWKSDGTPEGTMMVKDIAPSSTASPTGLTAHGGELWLFASDDLGTYGLWRSDGSEDGTQLIKPFGANVAAVAEEKVGDTLFFVLNNDVKHYELWISDGTKDGTKMIHDIGSSEDVNPPTLKGLGNILYFALDIGALWKSDGTPEGTTKVIDAQIIRRMASIGTTLFFVNADNLHGYELWQSDGTAEGTSMVADINPQPNAGSFPDWLTRVKDTLFFTADDGTHGVELWAYKP